MIRKVREHLGIFATCHLMVESVSTRLLFYFVASLLPYLVGYLIQIIGLVLCNLLKHVIRPLLILRYHIPRKLVHLTTLTKPHFVCIQSFVITLTILTLDGAIRSRPPMTRNILILVHLNYILLFPSCF